VGWLCFVLDEIVDVGENFGDIFVFGVLGHHQHQSLSVQAAVMSISDRRLP